VINLSLGGSGACSQPYAEAIAAVRATGAVVVVAAGNSTGHAVGEPANCPGAIGVAAVRHIGTKVGYSDVGPQLTIAAPGGNCVSTDPTQQCLYPILSTSNAGTTTPAASTYTDGRMQDAAVGTSFSAPWCRRRSR
jgi:serine protease